jgi:hypothetical protein
MDDPNEARHSTAIAMSPKGPSSTDIAASVFIMSLFDEEAYRVQVRRIPATLTEKEHDEELHRLASSEGIELPHSMDETEAVASSTSDTTMLSESTNMQGSIMSQSTAPTSCSSSERRPETSNSRVSTSVSMELQNRPYSSDAQKKRNSVFRSRMRRIVGKKRKDSSDSGAATITVNAPHADTSYRESTDLENASPRSPSPVRSLKSAWSNHVAPKQSLEYDQDPIALKRSMECRELVELQKEQQAERDRFLQFRHQLLSQLRHERDYAKGERKIAHDAVMADKRKAVSDFP